MTTTHTLDTPEAGIVYDVHGTAPAESPRPPLLMIGQPMTEEGFSADPEAAEAQRQQRIQTVDKAVIEREKGIQARRPEA